MDQRRTLARLIGELASGVIVVGANSMGGATSILHAAVEPDSIAGLVLTNSVFPWRGRAAPNPMVMLAFGLYWTPKLGERFVAWRLRELDAEQIVRISLGVLAADPSSVPEEVVRLLIELTEQRRHDSDVTRAFLGAARSMLRLGRRPAISRRALDHVRCPVLLLHGRRDRLVPAAYAEAELARHPAWRGRFFADLGHIPQMEAPGRWLAEVADWSAETFG